MMRSFLAVVSVAVLAPAAFGQLPASPYVLSGSCPDGKCRPVQAAANMVHAATIRTAESVREAGAWAASSVRPLSAGESCQPSRMAHRPGQPLRNVVRWVLR